MYKNNFFYQVSSPHRKINNYFSIYCIFLKIKKKKLNGKRNFNCIKTRERNNHNYIASQLPSIGRNKKECL